MDICILSMQEVNNMGSLLQSYAFEKNFGRNGPQYILSGHKENMTRITNY